MGSPVLPLSAPCWGPLLSGILISPNPSKKTLLPSPLPPTPLLTLVICPQTPISQSQGQTASNHLLTVHLLPLWVGPLA